MIIGQFHIKRIPSFAAKANPILLIYANAVLPRPVSLQRHKSVARRNAQVVECHYPMQQPKPPQGNPRNRRDASRRNSNSVSRSRNDRINEAIVANTNYIMGVARTEELPVRDFLHARYDYKNGE
jgi:hypothetical protein